MKKNIEATTISHHITLIGSHIILLPFIYSETPMRGYEKAFSIQT